MLVLSCFSRIQLCSAMNYSPPVPLSLGFLRQGRWRGLPFPSPGDLLEVWSRSVMSNSLRPHGPGSSVYGILQARILEWVAISFSRGSSQPRDRTQVSHIAGRCFILWATREARSSWTRNETHISYVSCIGRWVLYY